MGRAGGIHPKTHDCAKSTGAHFKAQMQRRPLALTKIISRREHGHKLGKRGRID
jgi:hypothetical protein